MSQNGASNCQHEARSVPHPRLQKLENYYRDATDPRLHEFPEDFGELYNRGHELFHKIFPDSRDDLKAAVDGVLDEARSKMRTKVAAVHRRLAIRAPRVRSRGLGGDCKDDDAPILERFNIKTVNLQDDQVVFGSGPVATAASAKSKR